MKGCVMKGCVMKGCVMKGCVMQGYVMKSCGVIGCIMRMCNQRIRPLTLEHGNKYFPSRSLFEKTRGRYDRWFRF